MKNIVGVALIALLAGAAALMFLSGAPEPPNAAVSSSQPEDLDRLPDGWYQSLRRDAIRPIYEPTFLQQHEVDWPADALVIGVQNNGDARAYPVSYLNRREMVNDVVGGLPLLVSW